MKRELVYYPNEILRQKAQPVRDFNHAELDALGQEMRQVMKENIGMGLAAPQVNDNRRVIVVEYTPPADMDEEAIPFTVLVNPEIVYQGKDTDEMNEGCLSIPYVEVPITRSTDITVAAQDTHGNPVKIKAKGLLARILQHEIDHLDGKLILDYEPKSETGAVRPRTIVWGSTEFTTHVMNTIRADFDITHIVTEPPKPAGRKQVLTPTVAKQYADTLGIPTIEPHDLHDPKLYTYLLSLKPDLMIVAAYGRLIPENLYSLPKHGTLNVHPSLLPKYRGATPIQAAILAGDKQTGTTIIRLAPQFDTGEIIAQAPYDLDGTETYGDLEVVLAELGGEILRAILKDYLEGNIIPMQQNEAEAIKTKKITREDRWLNLDESPEVNERKIRAYAPEPGAFVVLDGAVMKVLAAHLEGGALVFDLVQPAGKNPMTWSQFLHGYRKPLHFEPYSGILNK